MKYEKIVQPDSSFPISLLIQSTKINSLVGGVAINIHGKTSYIMNTSLILLDYFNLIINYGFSG